MEEDNVVAKEQQQTLVALVDSVGITLPIVCVCSHCR